MPVIWALRRWGVGIRSSSHPQLYREFEASLGYLRSIYKPSKQHPSCPVMITFKVEPGHVPTTLELNVSTGYLGF